MKKKVQRYTGPERRDPNQSTEDAKSGLANRIAFTTPGNKIDLREGTFGASFFEPTGTSWGDTIKALEDDQVLKILSKQRVRKLVKHINPDASPAEYNQGQVLDSLMMQRFRSNLESIDTTTSRGLRSYLHMQLGFLTALDAGSRDFIDLRPQAGKLASTLRDLVVSKGHAAELDTAIEFAHRLLLKHLPYRVAFGASSEAPALTRKLCSELWASAGLQRYLDHNFPIRRSAN